jgi:hypothetical protein
MASRRPSVPVLVARDVAQELADSAFSKRGRNAWTVADERVIVAISLDAMPLGHDLVGVSVGAYAIPAVVPRLLSECVGDGHNPQGIAWSVDQRDFSGPDAYEVSTAEPAAADIEALRRKVTEHLRPAAEHMLGGDELLAHMRAEP